MRCLDKRVLVGLGAIVLALFAVWPDVALVVAPFLIAAVCPLSMWVVMRRGDGGATCGGRRFSAADATSREAELAELRAEIDRLRLRQRGGEPRPATRE